jgi:hypothetical protein
MADFPFLSPRRNRYGPDGGMAGAGSEARILRDRQAAHSAALDRQTDRPQPYSSARMLVQAYDGGSMPATSEKVFFTHPVLVTGSESEGGAGTITVDTATTVPVIVLGHAPSAGDYLTAYACGGRWVTEQLSGSNTSTCYLAACTPCQIPKGDLTITWTNILTGNGSATLVYNCAGFWQTDCEDSGLLFTLSCAGGQIELRAIFFVSGVCPTGSSNYCSNLRTNPLGLTLSSHACSPFSLTYSLTETSCPELADEGNTQFVVTGPNTDFGTCPVCFTVVPCCAGMSTAGTVISIDGTPTTTGSCVTTVIDVGSPGPHTVTATLAGCVDFSESMTLACGNNYGITFSLASDRECCSACVVDKTAGVTVTLVSGLGGAFTIDLVYDSGTDSWLGSYDVACPGAINYWLEWRCNAHGGAAFNLKWYNGDPRAGGIPICGFATRATLGLDSPPTTFTCSPLFAFWARYVLGEAESVARSLQTAQR